MSEFQLVAPFQPAGDQPQAIESLLRGIEEGKRNQVLLGVTGSGQDLHDGECHCEAESPDVGVCRTTRRSPRSFTPSSKSSFRTMRCRISSAYYDYYQPEAYIPARDIYIEKDASINDDIDRLRLAATSALVSRRDVIVVASVSCIYGLGSPRRLPGNDGRAAAGGVVDRTNCC